MIRYISNHNIPNYNNGLYIFKKKEKSRECVLHIDAHKSKGMLEIDL